MFDLKGKRALVTCSSRGIGFDDLNEAVLKEHINPNIPGYFESTDEWNTEFSNDRIWS